MKHCRAILRHLGTLLASGLAIFSGCTGLQLAGSVSETTNGRIVGAIVEPGGAPAGRTRVLLLHADHDPAKNSAFVSADTTDSRGNYSFSKVAPGDYAIQAAHIDNRTSALIQGIHSDGLADTVATDTLRSPGTIKVILPAGVDAVNGYVYIPGTTIFTLLNAGSGFVTLDSVPAGEVAAVSYSSTGSSAASVIRYDVRVAPLDTATILNPGWKYSRKFVLNTSATGAGVAGNVADFPALVRLTEGVFDFSQAGNDGADIRFTKPDGAAMSYEIERWDAGAGLAEIWVRVDTVYGNDSAQSIVMYWGNADAAAQSSPSAVFDTADGFSGVWHLGRPAGTVVPDATANGITGTATATATVSGAIGAAQSFNGKSSLIQASGPASDKVNFPDSGAYSVSAWVKTSVLDTLCQAIVFKSNSQYGMQIIPEHDWEFATYIDKTRWEGSRSPASAGSWHAVAGVRNGTRQYLYIDGACVDSAKTSIIALPPENVARAYDKPLEIGHCPDGGRNPDRFFNGVIDEVRISKTALNADWIKLCYMNQKEQDALVKW